ncbi:MAG: hypothetical protein Q9171_002362 [Xanthocarpia ochracea]
MRLSFSPTSQRRVGRRSKLHNGKAAEGLNDSKSEDGIKDLNASPEIPITEAERDDREAEQRPRTSNNPETIRDSLGTYIHAQRNLPRDEDDPILNPFAHTAVFAARPPQTSSTSSLICHEDNALRNLLRFPDDAHTFCPLFLGPRIDGHALATFFGPYQTAEVSSACSCFESKLSTGCCTLTATTGDPSLKALVESILKGSETSVPSRPVSTSLSRDPATEDATFARPTEHWGPITTEVTATAIWQGPTSFPVSSKQSTPSETFTLSNASSLASSSSMTRTLASGAAIVVSDASLWLGGGDVLAPAVVAVIVRVFFPWPNPNVLPIGQS